MTIDLYEIDGRQYKMFNLLICGEYMNVASYALDEKVIDMMTETPSRYGEVRRIDELYGYSIDEYVEETEDAIRKHIEDLIYSDGGTMVDNETILRY